MLPIVLDQDNWVAFFRLQEKLQYYRKNKRIGIVMIENVILGFLMEQRLTGYDIKKFMEKSTNHFFNTSYGSIYPALKKLGGAGHLTSIEEINNGKLNKFYTITESGKAQFREWMAKNSAITMIRDEALCRMFFFSFLENNEIERQLNTYISELTAQIDMMRGLKIKYADYDIDPWKIKTLDFGIDYYIHMRESYTKIFKELKEKSNRTTHD